MNGFFAFLFLASIGAVLGGVIFLLYVILRKTKHNRRRILLFIAASVGVCAISGIMFAETRTPEQIAAGEQRRAEERAAKEKDAAEKKAEEQKAAAEEKHKQEQLSKSVVNEHDARAIDAAIRSTIRETEADPRVNSVRIMTFHESKEIMISLIVDSSVDRNTALELGDDLVKRYASNVATYGGSFSRPGDGAYGNLVYTYALSVAISYPNTAIDPDQWLYNQQLTPGKVIK